MVEDLQFIDTHHHLWDLEKLEYAWLAEEDPEETEVLGDYSSIRQTYLVTDLLKDFSGSNVAGCLGSPTKCEKQQSLSLCFLPQKNFNLP